MAHFAKLDSNNIVTQVVVVNNAVLLKADGTESELKGKQFLNTLFGTATWKQTSYNGNFRKQYAGVDFLYDSEKDKFISPQPFPSWSLNEDDDWEAPIPYPSDENKYVWNEDDQTWELFD